jgi:hypothetical protein
MDRVSRRLLWRQNTIGRERSRSPNSFRHLHDNNGSADGRHIFGQRLANVCSVLAACPIPVCAATGPDMSHTGETGPAVNTHYWVNIGFFYEKSRVLPRGDSKRQRAAQRADGRVKDNEGEEMGSVDTSRGGTGVWICRVVASSSP